MSIGEVISFVGFDLILVMIIPSRIRPMAALSYMSGISDNRINAKNRVKNGDNMAKLETVSDDAVLMPLYHIYCPNTITTKAYTRMSTNSSG